MADYKTNDILNYISKEKSFTKEDVNEVLTGFAEFLSKCVQEEKTLLIRGLGKLHYSTIRERKISEYTDKFGVFHPSVTLPQSKKVIFKLAKNIRGLDSEIEDEETLDKESEL